MEADLYGRQCPSNKRTPLHEGQPASSLFSVKQPWPLMHSEGAATTIYIPWAHGQRQTSDVNQGVSLHKQSLGRIR